MSKLKNVSLRGRYKAIEILLSKSPINIPVELSRLYICPNVGLLCGCLDPEESCYMKHNWCARCGDSILHLNDTMHYCSKCKCHYTWCFRQNTHYTDYCPGHNIDELLVLEVLNLNGYLCEETKNKLIRVAEYMNDQRCIKGLLTGEWHDSFDEVLPIQTLKV